MKRILKISTMFLFIVVTMLILLPKTSVKADDENPCSVLPTESSNIIVDTIQSITNDPDSGYSGNWAVDTISRHLQIWETGKDKEQKNHHSRRDHDVTFCGKITDTGTFVTTGPLSPNSIKDHTASLSAGITGTITGGATFSVHGKLVDDEDDLSTITPSALDCNKTDCVTNGTLHELLSQYLNGESHNYYSWGWTYVTCGNGTWVDAQGNAAGAITNGDITGTPASCLTPSSSSSSSSGGSSSGGSSSSTNPPGAPACTIPFAAPILTGGVRNNATTVTYSWWKSLDQGVDFQAIVFGYSPNDLNMGAFLNKNVTSLTINFLHSKQPVYAQIWAFKGGCASMSNTLEIK